jgi:hypothetical protein
MNLKRYHSHLISSQVYDCHLNTNISHVSTMLYYFDVVVNIPYRRILLLYNISTGKNWDGNSFLFLYFIKSTRCQSKYFKTDRRN